MTLPDRIRGLYAITPDTPETDWLLNASAQALAGGARLLQYRNKSTNAALRRQQAEGLARLCRQADALFIINDDVDLAAAIEADGVHLGEDDAALAAARARLGADAIIGVSCYNSLAAAAQAQREGASYVAFGSLYPSRTKPQARRASLSLLQDARSIGLPIVAIGGITLENAAPAIAAGANALAVISAVFDSADIAASARAFAGLFAAAGH